MVKLDLWGLWDQPGDVNGGQVGVRHSPVGGQVSWNLVFFEGKGKERPVKLSLVGQQGLQAGLLRDFPDLKEPWGHQHGGCLRDLDHFDGEVSDVLPTVRQVNVNFWQFFFRVFWQGCWWWGLRERGVHREGFWLGLHWLYRHWCWGHCREGSDRVHRVGF